MPSLTDTEWPTAEFIALVDTASIAAVAVAVVIFVIDPLVLVVAFNGAVPSLF